LYLGNSEDLLLGVIADMLEDFRDQIPQTLAQAGANPMNA